MILLLPSGGHIEKGTLVGRTGSGEGSSSEILVIAIAPL